MLLLDGDTQGTALSWKNVQGEKEDALPVVAVNHATIESDLKPLTPAFDYLVIDGAAKLAVHLIAPAVRIADFVGIVVQASPVDVWASPGIVESIKARQEVTEGKPAAGFIVNRLKAGTRLSRAVDDALAPYSIPVLESRISDRVAFSMAMGAGLSVAEYEADQEIKDTPGTKEMNSLIDEILSVI